MRIRSAAALALLFLALAGSAAAGQPISSPDSAYADYADVLSRYVRNGGVDYAQWKADDPPSWRRFLAWLESADPVAWPVASRRAFWINAYNSRVVAGVLRRYPIDSVRDVGFLGGRLGGFFTRREHPVAGASRTLDEIEREILLTDPLWDSRIPWSLTCASRGCPQLRPEPYRATALERQLEFQAATYLNSPAGHRLDPEERKVYLSRIFDWHRGDFERAAGTVRAYALRYLTGTALEALNAGWEIEYMDYDWRLNDADR
ncbi:MAG: DUF547 domain-containing protein, partial [Gemmatimonadota bacterium]